MRRSKAVKGAIIRCECPIPGSKAVKGAIIRCECPIPVTKSSKERVVPCVINTTGSKAVKGAIIRCECPIPVTKSSKERVVPRVINTTESSECPKKSGVTCQCLAPDSVSTTAIESPRPTGAAPGSDPSYKQSPDVFEAPAKKCPELCEAPANRGLKVQVHRKVPAEPAAWSPLFNKR
ncbi:uncharacterized protein LOC134805168 [Cydia splendana]|uniref:uncharacterized protein LOC134805168 n=1 Tax=Cydia splendana TaxID=1100963 RepID=UPI00300DA4A2